MAYSPYIHTHTHAASLCKAPCTARDTVTAMLLCEIEAWSRWASPYSINSVAHVAIDAMNAWPMRISGNRELADLAPWCPSVWAWPVQWSEAAALAAAEMAIVCHIWPDPLNEVLRPAGIAGKNV